MTQNDPVVVTGMGAVSPLGVGVETNWQRLLEGKSGVVRNDRFDVSAYACTIAGLVPPRDRDPHGFDPRDHIDAKDIKKMDRFIQYGLAAADEALNQARWTPQSEAERARTATVIGSGVGGSPLMVEAVETILTRGPRPPITLHGSRLSRQSRRWLGVDPLWLHRSHRCAGYGLCGGWTGYR